MPGTPFRAAEDNDLFDRFFAAGYLGRYEPAGNGWHEQWRTRSQLVKLVANALINGDTVSPNYDAASFQLERHLLEEVVATTRRRGIPLVIVVCATEWELNAVASKPYDERARVRYGYDRGFRLFYAMSAPENASARNVREEGFVTRFEVHHYVREAG